MEIITVKNTKNIILYPKQMYIYLYCLCLKINIAEAPTVIITTISPTIKPTNGDNIWNALSQPFLGIPAIYWIMICLVTCCCYCLCMLCVFYVGYERTKKETANIRKSISVNGRNSVSIRLKNGSVSQQSVRKQSQSYSRNRSGSNNVTIVYERKQNNNKMFVPLAKDNKNVSIPTSNRTADGDITTHNINIEESNPGDSPQPNMEIISEGNHVNPSKISSSPPQSHPSNPSRNNNINQQTNGDNFLFANGGALPLTNSTRASLNTVMDIMKQKPQIMLVMMDQVNKMNKQIINQMQQSQSQLNMHQHQHLNVNNNNRNRHNSMPISQDHDSYIKSNTHPSSSNNYNNNHNNINNNNINNNINSNYNHNNHNNHNNYNNNYHHTRLRARDSNESYGSPQIKSTDTKTGKTNIEVMTPTPSDVDNAYEKYLKKQKIIAAQNMVISNNPLPDEMETYDGTVHSGNSNSNSNSSSSSQSSQSTSDSSDNDETQDTPSQSSYSNDNDGNNNLHTTSKGNNLYKIASV